MRSDSDSSTSNDIGVIGTTGLVGGSLLPILTQSDWRVFAYSRSEVERVNTAIEWRRLSSVEPISEPLLPFWICLAPIWTLPEHFSLLEAQGARRVVALSSTSLFTKDASSDPAEQAIARKLAEGERRLQTWAETRGIEWIIIRPTLIYGLGRDKNVSEIARFICRWGFFPLLGKANGLRQPVHAEDVAMACHAATLSQSAVNQAYNIGGGEMLPYREMVGRIFLALGKRPCFTPLPRWLWIIAIGAIRLLPRFRHWSIDMVERMNSDMVFDNKEVEVALGVYPRHFNLEAKDLPECHRL